MFTMFSVRVSARQFLLLRCLLIVGCIPWMSRRSLDPAIPPWLYCRVPPSSTRTSVSGTRARLRTCMPCSRYVFLPACCSCCVASSSLCVSPGCLDAHWTRPLVPGCTTVVCLCLQPAHRYLGHELGDGDGWHVRGTCFCPSVASAALPPHHCMYPLDVSTLTGHGHSSLGVLL